MPANCHVTAAQLLCNCRLLAQGRDLAWLAAHAPPAEELTSDIISDVDVDGLDDMGGAQAGIAQKEVGTVSAFEAPSCSSAYALSSEVGLFA